MYNTEQKEYLARYGASSVHEIENPLVRLQFTEIDTTPDPTPAPSYNEAQTMFLLGRSVDDLDDLQRQILASMGTTADAADTPTAAQPANPSGAPKLDVAKLQSMPMSPTARLEVFEWFEVLETAHREAQSGIEPHLRSTRYDVERAHMFCAPYLVA